MLKLFKPVLLQRNIKMRLEFKLVVLLVGLLPCCFGSIDFLDCGSDHIDVDTVSITGCEDAICLLTRGQTHNVIITPTFLDPEINHVDLDVKAMIRGALFDVDAHFLEPCGLPCPITDKVIAPNIPINMELSSSLIRGYAPLIINASYSDGNVHQSHFCVQFYVYIQ